MADTETNPFETPCPRQIRLTQWVLRVVVAIQCLGFAIAYLHHQTPAPFCEFLCENRGLTEDQSKNISDVLAYVIGGCGVFTLLRPTTFLLLPLIIYQAGNALIPPLLDQSGETWLISAMQTTQVITPLALMLVDFWPPKIRPGLAFCLAAITLLKFATAITFMALGATLIHQCWAGGDHLDLLQSALFHGFHRDVALDDLRTPLGLWGAILIGMACALLTGRSRIAMAGCVVLGLVTTCLPILADNSQGYSQTLMRITESGAPLAILVFHLTAVREQPPLYLAEKKK